MQNVFHHVTRHAKKIQRHVQIHHKKYIFGLFGGFAIAKMFIFFVASFGIFQYSHSTFADEICTMTGQVYVEEHTDCALVPGYYTGGADECTMIPGYYTGGNLNESGEMINQIYIEASESCVVTGQVYVEEHEECVMITGYYTGGTELCVDIPLAASLDENNVCDADDIQRTTPSFGNAPMKGVISFSWEYLTDDCLVQATKIELWDHNGQWIRLGELSGGVTGYLFDSILLSGYANASGLVVSGIYTVVDASGAVQWSGVASGTYHNLWTGYQVRLLNGDEQLISQSSGFTIDNNAPYLTGTALSSPQAVSSMVGRDDEVILSFTASEELTGLNVAIGGTGASLLDRNGNYYRYSQIVHSGFSQGHIDYRITYSDLAGNSGLVTGTGLYLDNTLPTLSQFILTGSIASGRYISFTASEPVRFALQYLQSGSSAQVEYLQDDSLTGHEYTLSGIQLETRYDFTLQLDDVVHNTGNYKGSFVISSTGSVILSYALSSGSLVTTGVLMELSNILKEEINKFNTCKAALEYNDIELNIHKNMYMLHIPSFTKTYVKQVVSAFTLLVLDRVEQDKALTQPELQEITDKFDNFLIILKLIRDDENACKQNLSNYHISQFKRALDEYGIYFK